MTGYWASRKPLLLPLKTRSDFLRSAPSTCSFDFIKLVIAVTLLMQSCLSVRKSITQCKIQKNWFKKKNGCFCNLTCRGESRTALSYWSPYTAHVCRCLRTISVTNPHTEKLPRASRKQILPLLVVYAFSSTNFLILHSQISGNTGR